MESTFVFAGNRTFVFEEMLKLGLSVVHTFAVKDSYLHTFLKGQEKVSYSVIDSKKQLINAINALHFDYFVANGLPVILPITKLTTNNKKKFINVHPSYLPDLRGADPVPGALLYGRDSGATCHYMDDGIDTGKIIAQEKIPYCVNFDVNLLYKLCFKAECKVFKESYENGFVPLKEQVVKGDEIYYSFKQEDLNIHKGDSISNIIKRVKAFSNASKGVIVELDNIKYKFFDIEIIESDYLTNLYQKNVSWSVLEQYADNVLIKVDTSFALLKRVSTL